MSDYNTIRLRQIAHLKIAQGKDLTDDERIALTDYVVVKESDDDKLNKKYPKKTRPKLLDGKGEIIDQMRDDGLSMTEIARFFKVSITCVREDLLRRGKV